MSELRLLILDDDPMVGGIIEAIAQSIGAHARLETSAQEFFASLGRWCPTHIVLDMRMPEMGGREVLRLLALQSCDARIILTSGDASEAEEVRQGSHPELLIIGFLAKPFGPAGLRALLN